MPETELSVGPDEELEELYRRHGTRLWRALVAYAAEPEIASDAVAEAFAQALSRGAELRSPLRWIWRVAFRVAAGELKERQRDRTLSTEDPSYEMQEPARELVDALKLLSPRQRAALVLHYYGDWPTKEIAAILGISTATVRVHLSQGRKRLRLMLEDTDD